MPDTWSGSFDLCPFLSDIRDYCVTRANGIKNRNSRARTNSKVNFTGDRALFA